jgi:outer membrane protein assembly factor BamB
MHVVYRTPLVATSRRTGEAYERGQIEIDAKHYRLFIGSSDQGLYCVDARDGSVHWRFETVGAVQSAPLYDAATESLYFGSSDGALYKVDARNGELRYRFATNAEVSERPVLVQGRLYFVNANDTVIALDAATGKMLWNQHRTPTTGMQIVGNSGILVWRSRVFVGFSDGIVVAYDATSGVERWQPVDLAAEAESNLGVLPQHFDVDTTPVAGYIDGSPVVYVASAEGGLFALDADSGTQVWQNPGVVGTTQLLLWEPKGASDAKKADDDNESTNAPLRKLLVAATGSSGLWAIEPNDGSVVWRSRLPDGGVAGPTPIAGALLVSASQLGVYLVSPINGRVMDGIHLTEGVSALPAAYGQHAFFLTNQGQLTSLHIAAPGREPKPSQSLLGGGSYSRGHW